ncbi:hypothetical protein L6164_023355 [Bauhinia variegata]|uniref:Uncharacterized protein n=1 Tax=Bauhinia variegata TaxID=167791 RepID=A0ACB9MLB1_BAUVA|nr:hypothetical protein L6164_023355 [Bauhinia variegata]
MRRLKRQFSTIKSHGLGDEGLNMVSHCRSHKEVKIVGRKLAQLYHLGLRKGIGHKRSIKICYNIPSEAISNKLETKSNANCCIKCYNQLTSPMVFEGIWCGIDDYCLLNALFTQ